MVIEAHALENVNNIFVNEMEKHLSTIMVVIEKVLNVKNFNNEEFLGSYIHNKNELKFVSGKLINRSSFSHHLLECNPRSVLGET